MALAPVFSAETERSLAALGRYAQGGALLLTSGGDIALVRGDVTGHGAHIARSNAPLVRSSPDETASFSCDDGTSVHLLAITEGWVLAVQALDRPGFSDLASLSAKNDERAKLVHERMRRLGPTGLKVLMRGVRDSLSQMLSYLHQGYPSPNGGHGSGHGGAPAEVFAELPRKRWN